jgi:hypothetical protein
MLLLKVYRLLIIESSIMKTNVHQYNSKEPNIFHWDLLLPFGLKEVEQGINLFLKDHFTYQAKLQYRGRFSISWLR